MKLYLVRHGDAVSAMEDGSRPLSAVGRREVLAVAEHLREMGVTIGEIEHSGKTRAVETAEILAETLSCDAVNIRPGLLPNDSPTDLIKELQAREEDIMMVGHLPFMAIATSLLVADESAPMVAFETATVVCLERKGQGGWTIVWVIGPHTLALETPNRF